MKFSIRQYAEALHLSFQDVAPKDHDTIIDNFLAILKDNGDLEHYETIVLEYERLDKEDRGIKTVEVTAAREATINKELIHELNKIVGKDIDLKKKIDEQLVGGVMVQVDDTLIDASVKGQLGKLKNALSK
jgi:F-type H+-transporting ATPase subunit delta